MSMVTYRYMLKRYIMTVLYQARMSSPFSLNLVDRVHHRYGAVRCLPTRIAPRGDGAGCLSARITPSGQTEGCLPVRILPICHSRRRLGNHGDLGLPREWRAHNETLIRQLYPLRLVVPGAFSRRRRRRRRRSATLVALGMPYKSRDSQYWVFNIGRLSKYVLKVHKQTPPPH